MYSLTHLAKIYVHFEFAFKFYLNACPSLFVAVLLSATFQVCQFLLFAVSFINKSFLSLISVSPPVDLNNKYVFTFAWVTKN